MIDVGNVSTSGTTGYGLDANAVIGSATAIGRTITTTGDIGFDVLAQARQDATVGFDSISTSGNNATGIVAQATLGTIAVDGGSVTTSGDFSRAVDARATTGKVSITLAGPVVTSGRQHLFARRSPSAATQRPVRFIEGARNIWYNVADIWTAHMRDGRDGRDAPASGSRLWGQAYGSVMQRKDGSALEVAGQAPADAGIPPRLFSGQSGYDLVRGGDDAMGIRAGITGGYSTLDLNFAASTTRGRYDSANGGAYRGLTLGPAFANVLGLYERHWLAARDSQPVYSRHLEGNSFGLSGEMGLHFESDRLFAEPLATLAYVHTNLDDFQHVRFPHGRRLSRQARPTAWISRSIPGRHPCDFVCGRQYDQGVQGSGRSRPFEQWRHIPILRRSYRHLWRRHSGRPFSFHRPYLGISRRDWQLRKQTEWRAGWW